VDYFYLDLESLNDSSTGPQMINKLMGYVFNNLNYMLPICLLSLAVGFSVYNEGQMAILKGLRQLRYLANVGVLTLNGASAPFGAPSHRA
jgi:hypothetical protein